MSRPLSPRQLEVLRLIAEGRSQGQIAAELGISPKTVEAHRAAVRIKTGAEGTAGLTRLAIHLGLVPADWKVPDATAR